jgi:hypothetical protein
VGGVGSMYPSASVLVELAQPLGLREEFVHPSELAPLYLRKADTRINWEQRDRHQQPVGPGLAAGEGR